MTNALCLDIETYGACTSSLVSDRSLPRQTQFHPKRCLSRDGVQISDLVLSVALTPVVNKRPMSTFVLKFSAGEAVSCLLTWLQWADELWGMNFLYDVLFLRTNPTLRDALNGQHRIVDLGVLNYLHSELRPERSLKNLGPVLGLWSYADEIAARKGHRFTNWNDLAQYNAEDTHNTAMGILELQRRIREDFPNTHKLSEWCYQFYSDLIWTAVHMSESGLTIDSDKLESLRATCTSRKEEAAVEAYEKHGCKLEGEGSATAKRFCMEELTYYHPEILDEPLLRLTPRNREISFSATNRRLVTSLLPVDNHYRGLMELMGVHARATKLVTSYITPLVEQHGLPRARPDRRLLAVYPSWHLFPGPFKDGSGSSGGTQQGRITATAPAIQTNPREIKECLTSRYSSGVMIWGDLSQIELRVAGLLSGEPTLLQNYREGADLHRQRAIDVFGADCINSPYFHSGDNEHDPRQHAKQFNFADLFRAGARKLRELLLVETGRLFTPEFCQRVVRQRRTLRPTLWAWQEGCLQEAGRTGYLHLPFTGQSRYLDPEDDHNAILNFPIQTTAGNTLHRIKHYILRHLPHPARLCADIYDAVAIDTPLELADEVEDLIQRACKWVAELDYWSMLQEHYLEACPLIVETKRQAA